MYKKNLALTSILLGSSLALSVGSFNPASAALLWDWSILDDGYHDLPSSGTFTTDGTTYNTTETYQITAITGTSNIGAIGSTGSTITGLSTNYGEDNKLQWDGANLLTDFNGIGWEMSVNGSLYIYYSGDGFGIPKGTSIGYGVVSATLFPVVPEPLNVLGAVVALGLGIGLKRQLASKKQNA